MERSKKNVGMALIFSLGVFIFSSASLAGPPVKLGFVYIMSGPFGMYGLFAKHGAEMAIDEINQSGGILGQKIEAVFEDSAGNPDIAIQGIRKLVFQEKADCLIGLDSSGVAKSVVPSIAQMKTPLIITHAATPDVTGSLCNKYTFRISLNLSQNVKTAAMIASHTRAKIWSTVGPDYAFGHQSWEYFQKYLMEQKPGMTFFPKDKIAFPPFKTTDFSSYIAKVMQSKPQGVFISLWGVNLVNFIRQGKEMGFFNGDFEVLISLGGATEVLYALKEKMPEGLWVGTRYWFLANDSAINKKFREGYFRRFNQYPSYNAHGAYGAVRTYKAAVEKAETMDKEAVVKAMEGLSIELPVGRITIRPEDHQAVTDACWGKTAADPDYPIRILKPARVFRGKKITPSVEEAGCK